MLLYVQPWYLGRAAEGDEPYGEPSSKSADRQHVRRCRDVSLQRPGLGVLPLKLDYLTRLPQEIVSK